MDNVNHPSHYRHSDGRDCIDVMTDVFGPTNVMIFCLLNAYKYVDRYQYKGKPVEDLQKAKWYIQYFMSHAHYKKDVNRHDHYDGRDLCKQMKLLLGEFSTITGSEDLCSRFLSLCDEAIKIEKESQRS